MVNENLDQFDVIKFLSTEPKIIADFRQSKLFFVDRIGRGVYPRSLITMLIDLELLTKFTPYKSNKDEIAAFIETLKELSDDRKTLLKKYTSFQLTAAGKETIKTSDERQKIVKKKTSVIVAPKALDKLVEKIEAKVTKELEKPKNQEEVSIVSEVPIEDLSEEISPKDLVSDKKEEEKEINEKDVDIPIDEELAIIEGSDEEGDTDEEAEKMVRVSNIIEELKMIDSTLSNGKMKKKERKKLLSKKEDLIKERLVLNS